MIFALTKTEHKYENMKLFSFAWCPSLEIYSIGAALRMFSYHNKSYLRKSTEVVQIQIDRASFA